MAKKISTPFIVGGGLSSLEDLEDIFARGAAKASINSAAVKNPDFIRLASEKFGPEKIVLAMDVKKVGEKKWNVFTKGGSTDSGIDAIAWAKKMEELGAGQMVINSIDGDGSKEGYDIELLKEIKKNINLPIVASGGAGKLEDFLQVAKEAHVEGLLAASVFHYREIEIRDLKSYLNDNNIEVSL